MRKHNHKIAYCREEQGFTLTEMAIVLVVTGILITASAPFFRLNVDSYIQVRNGKDIIQSGRIGFNRMMSELHRIEDPLDITYASSSSIHFIVDSKLIVYELYNNVLLRNDERFIDQVQGFTVYYYQDDGILKSTPFSYDSNVWRIQIELTVGDESNNFLLRGQVSPRNIHYN
jgi:prepilin-type N-terminal cleavage/methylation domain-containing protein